MGGPSLHTTDKHISSASTVGSFPPVWSGQHTVGGTVDEALWFLFHLRAHKCLCIIFKKDHQQLPG